MGRRQGTVGGSSRGQPVQYEEGGPAFLFGPQQRNSLIRLALGLDDEAGIQAIEGGIEGGPVLRIAGQDVGHRHAFSGRPGRGSRKELHRVGEFIEGRDEAFEQVHLGRGRVVLPLDLPEHIRRLFESALFGFVLLPGFREGLSSRFERLLSRFHSPVGLLPMRLLLPCRGFENPGLFSCSFLLLFEEFEAIRQPVEAAVVVSAFLGELLLAATKFLKRFASCYRSSVGLISCLLCYMEHAVGFFPRRFGFGECSVQAFSVVF